MYRFDGVQMETRVPGQVDIVRNKFSLKILYILNYSIIARRGTFFV